MKGMEYEEATMPEDVSVRAEKLAELQAADPNNPDHTPTMENTGFIDWINKKGREGWRVVWSMFRQPYVLFEREIVVEEVQK